MPVRTYTDSQGRRRYAVEFETRAHRVFRRLPPGATKGQATELETRLRHELIDQAVVGRRPHVPLETAIAEWLGSKVRKSAAKAKSHAGIVLELAREVPGLAFAEGLAEVAAKLRAAELAPGTINRRLCVLKATAKYAWRQGWAAENLSGKIELLPETAYRRREVTPEMARALIDAARTKRAKALIALSAYTGLRLGEVLRLRPEHVDARRGILTVLDRKNGTDLVIPILAELRPHLAEIPIKAGWRNVYRGWTRARAKAGLPWVRYHDLRHMVGSALTNTGADLRLVADILGHKSLQTTRRYTHPDVEAKRRALTAALRAAPIRAPIKRRKKPAAKSKKAA